MIVPEIAFWPDPLKISLLQRPIGGSALELQRCLPS